MSARGLVVGLAAAFLLAMSCARGGTGATQDVAGRSCEGVSCNAPPSNACANADDLTVYEPNGTCGNGACGYASNVVPCPSGCVNDACDGDPCLGVSCVTPPANQCADATHLTVEDSPGTCDQGTCAYGSHQEVCPNGCTGGVCTGDPCIGVTCNSAPAKYCLDANNLKVFDVPGTCMTGSCQYANHSEYCAFGCVNGACMNDPCVGVSCMTPPAAYCSAANTRRVYTTAGMCSGGVCSYAYTDQSCPNGCANGVCLECQTTANCPSGKWCNGGTCASCNMNQHCGAGCLDCTATGDYCNAASTACVDCVLDSQCPSANYCSSGACATCNVAAHCGAACSVCSGTTPVCNGTGCACSGASCGAYNQCVSGSCVECNTAAACGASCTACGGATPYCLDQGATSACVECLTNASCAMGETCSGGTCVSGCPAPASACTTGGNQDGVCAGSYTITRAAAGSAGGFHVDDTYGLCGRNNDFASVAGCESGGASNGSDAGYRLYMKAGETAHIVLTRGSSTCLIGWNGTISLKVYGTACSADCSSCPQTCSTLHFCAQDNTQDINFVAPSSGWYVIVVDSRGASTDDVGGVFDLVVNLTCPGGACTCP